MPRRLDPVYPERSEHPRGHRIELFRSDHAGDYNDTIQHSQPVYRRLACGKRA